MVTLSAIPGRSFTCETLAVDAVDALTLRYTWEEYRILNIAKGRKTCRENANITVVQEEDIYIFSKIGHFKPPKKKRMEGDAQNSNQQNVATPNLWVEQAATRPFG